MQATTDIPTSAPDTRVIYADELLPGAVLLIECEGIHRGFLRCDAKEATTHEDGRQHRLQVQRVRRGWGVVVIAIDEDGRQMSWTDGTNGAVHVTADRPTRREPVAVPLAGAA